MSHPRPNRKRGNGVNMREILLWDGLRQGRTQAAWRTCLSRSIALAHLIREKDRPAVGAWGPYVLKSAFQPIFGFDGGKLSIEAFEGLIRPFREGEAVTPATFFHAIQAGERLHAETLTRTLHLLNAGMFLDPATMLFINFDPSVFGERAVAEAALRDMRLTLHESGIDARRIVCEVTEQKSTSGGALERFVDLLRDHGFRIAVDDYGAEESDMERVAALRPDIVKFDAQWIARLMDTRPGFALLSVMVGEFASRGIRIVFEGIEEHWQLECAEECGAHMVQGYILARPEIAPTSFAVFARSGVDAASGQEGGTSEPRVGETSSGRRADAQRRVFGRRPTA